MNKMTCLLDVSAQIKRRKIGLQGFSGKMGPFWLSKNNFGGRQILFPKQAKTHTTLKMAKIGALFGFQITIFSGKEIQSPKQARTHTGIPVSIIFANVSHLGMSRYNINEPDWISMIQEENWLFLACFQQIFGPRDLNKP